MTAHQQQPRREHTLPKRRFGSLEARLASVTALVLLFVSAMLFFELTSRERTKLIEAKTNAATMLMQLVAAGLAAPIDFGDADEMSARLDDLRANPDIVCAAVWTDPAAPPNASWQSADCPSAALAAGEPDGTRVTSDWLTAIRTVTGPRGQVLGRARVVFTLRPENEAFRASRKQLLGMTAGLAAATAFLLALLARRYVVGPLTRLAHAATALADGDLSARVDIRADDEIGDLARAFNVMSSAVAFREERLHKEVELAQHIQTSILPRSLDVPGLEMAATMVPASKVGGDYYDVLPIEGGCWIGIGDVAGHGLDAGLIMLMTQSAVAALVARDPASSPRDVVCLVNEVLYDNIRKRLQRDDHATFMILHYAHDGNIVFAGGHEDIIVYRKRSRKCEVIAVPGAWVGGRRDIRAGTVESRLRLEAGDVMLLYTDGAIELRNEKGEEFGVERLCAALESQHGKPVSEIREHLLYTVASWGPADDDVTLLLSRFNPGAQAGG